MKNRTFFGFVVFLTLADYTKLILLSDLIQRHQCTVFPAMDDIINKVRVAFVVEGNYAQWCLEFSRIHGVDESVKISALGSAHGTFDNLYRAIAAKGVADGVDFVLLEANHSVFGRG